MAPFGRLLSFSNTSRDYAKTGKKTKRSRRHKPLQNSSVFQKWHHGTGQQIDSPDCNLNRLKRSQSNFFVSHIVAVERSALTEVGDRPSRSGLAQRDRYLRRILVVGACSVLRRARQQPEKYSWLIQLLARRPFKVVAVALANKMARVAWALLAKGGTYRAPHLMAA